MSNTPLMFMRIRSCKPDSDVLPNCVDHRRSYIVVLPAATDFTLINTAWQGNPDFPDGEIFVPGIDLLDEEQTFIFDGDDPYQNYRDALCKMKELWAQLTVE